MTVDGVTLGGRLPLYDREALEPAQKELFDWLMNKAVPWAEGAGFQAGIEAGQLIGPFNPALLTPAISKAFMDFVLVEHENTSLSQRAREVVILTVGAAWQAPYELYAHCAVGRHVGLSDDEVRILAEGAAKESQRYRNGGPSRRACPVGRASSRRCTLSRGRKAAGRQRDHGRRHTHRHLSHRMRNPQRIRDTRAVANRRWLRTLDDLAAGG
jgi:hypothetical protein